MSILESVKDRTSGSKRTVLIVAALMVSLLAARVFIFIPYFGLLFMAMGVFAFIALGTALMKGSREKKYTDPYDLELLREIHEREAWSEADTIEEDPEADIVCPHCGHIYGHKFGVCPQCKRVP